MSTPQKRSVPFEYNTPDDARVDDCVTNDVLSTFDGKAYNICNGINIIFSELAPSTLLIRIVVLPFFAL